MNKDLTGDRNINIKTLYLVYNLHHIPCKILSTLPKLIYYNS